MLRTVSALALLLCLAGFAPASFAGARLPSGFVDELLASGLDFPVAMAFLPDGRLLVTEKNSGRIRLLVDDHLTGPAVATIDSVASICDGIPCTEAGLLGIAVDPGWPARPYLYTTYNWSGGPYLRLARLTATGDLDHTGTGLITAAPEDEYLVLAELPDFNPIHNGGTLRFAPDGMLLVGLGDDFSECLVPDSSQLVGKLLRIDVGALPPGPGRLTDYALITPPDNPFAGDPDPRARLVWASGFRNPWGFHVDSPTGRIFATDVGEFSFEEVNIVDAPGLQFGWPWYEAFLRTERTCSLEDSSGSRSPIHSYDRRNFFTYSAIMGAGVYRRPPGNAPRAFPPEYEGDYFFSDLGAGFLRRLKEVAGVWWLAPPVPGQPNSTDWGTRLYGVTEYQIASDGALWYVKSAVGTATNSGEIHRIVGPPTTSAAPAEIALPFRLERPFPSPSRGAVTLGFTLARAAPVNLTVWDLSGRAIRTLARGEVLKEGHRSVAWDGRDTGGRRVPAGIYVVSLATPEGVASSRCLIVR